MAYPPIKFKGKLGRIPVACDECGVAYDVRDILNETTHPGALHVRPWRQHARFPDGGIRLFR
jgi:hypothetical protein